MRCSNDRAMKARLNLTIDESLLEKIKRYRANMASNVFLDANVILDFVKLPFLRCLSFRLPLSLISWISLRGPDCTLLAQGFRLWEFSSSHEINAGGGENLISKNPPAAFGGATNWGIP